jgi:hypothetical protein
MLPSREPKPSVEGFEFRYACLSEPQVTLTLNPSPRTETIKVTLLLHDPVKTNSECSHLIIHLPGKILKATRTYFKSPSDAKYLPAPFWGLSAQEQTEDGPYWDAYDDPSTRRIPGIGPLYAGGASWDPKPQTHIVGSFIFDIQSSIARAEYSNFT